MTRHLLGISAYYHDAAAALLRDGDIVAAAQEERFSRKKHDASFPASAVAFCLKQGGISLRDVSAVVFYDKPFVKFERMLESYFASAPRGFGSFRRAMPIWLKEKLLLKPTLREALATALSLSKKEIPPILFAAHHESHAASAFYPSPFESAAVLCLDGVGEWATTSTWRAEGEKLEALWEIDFPHSLGLLYSAFTHYTGFRVNSGEYKLMGLAPYGEAKYVETILRDLVDLKADGTFRLNLDYFDFVAGEHMTSEKFHRLFGGAPRTPEQAVTAKDMDLAASIQKVTEEIILRLGRTLHAETGIDNLCMAGGVALNCVANGRLLREGPFKKIWVQPAADDAGGALGAAYVAWFSEFAGKRAAPKTDAMKGAYLGPEQSEQEILDFLKQESAPHQEYDEARLCAEVAALLAAGNVVGWFQGRMEFGPRALGARSILGDARSVKMQSQMNLKIKFRESFRPFAPIVLAERTADYFDLAEPSPYMLLTAQVSAKQRRGLSDEERSRSGLQKLTVARSSIPAVTHVDDSARLQTVHAETNPLLHRLLSAFEEQTGCAVLINTSFNVRGEPIVCTAADAYFCFLRTEIDYLVLGRSLLKRSEQDVTRRQRAAATPIELD